MLTRIPGSDRRRGRGLPPGSNVAGIAAAAAIALLSGRTLAQDAPPLDRQLVRQCEARPDSWRLRELGPFRIGDEGPLPCAVAEWEGRVAVAFAGEDGMLWVRTNLFRGHVGWPQSTEDERKRWGGRSLTEEPAGWLAIGITESKGHPTILILHLEQVKKYEVWWSWSCFDPGSWQSRGGGTNASAPKWPAFAMARDDEGSVFAVHNDPLVGALGYYTRREGYEPVVVPVAGDERIVALAVDPHGDLHALTHHEGKLFYLTNRGGSPHREVVEEREHEGMRASLTAAPDGGVHVLFRDAGSGGLSYMKKTEKGWEAQVVEAGDDVGLVCALRTDREGALHMCYSVPSGLRYATNRTGDWTCVAVVAGTDVDGCDLVVDREGFVHVCYADRSRKQMVYATNRPAREDDAR